MATPSTDTKSSGTSDAPDYREEVQAEMAEIKNDLAALTKSLAKYGKARAEGLQDRAFEWSDEMMEDSLQAIKKLRKQVSRLEKDMETNVREHPLQWILGAVGLGLVIAMLMGRNRD